MSPPPSDFEGVADVGTWDGPWVDARPDSGSDRTNSFIGFEDRKKDGYGGSSSYPTGASNQWHPSPDQGNRTPARQGQQRRRSDGQTIEGLSDVGSVGSNRLGDELHGTRSGDYETDHEQGRLSAMTKSLVRIAEFKTPQDKRLGLTILVAVAVLAGKMIG